MSFNFSELRRLLANNQAEAVIQTLVEQNEHISPKGLQAEVIQLSARWKEFQDKSRQDLLSTEAAGLEQRQIIAVVVRLLDKIEAGEDPAPAGPEKSFNWKRFFVTAGAIIAALAGLAQITGLDLMSILSDDPPRMETDSTDSKEEPVHTDILEPTISKPNADRETGHTTESTKEPTKEKVEKITSQKLAIKAKTNKGINDLVFQQGETMRLYYQVSRPCYLRVIYEFENGDLVLLENDLQIPEKQVGKELELGDGYDPSAPFGQERIYFFAQSKKFPELNIEEVDGYRMIKDNISTTLSKTRGMKARVSYAEFKLDLTTKEE